MTVAPKRNAYNTSTDTRMHRLWNPVTRCYLHLSGQGETPDVGLSWLGYAYQADTLRSRANGDWPYVRRPRDEVRESAPSFDQVDA